MREKYKEFLDLWSKFVIYAEKTPPGELLLSESFDSFVNLVNAKRRFEYHQHDASEYNNIWEEICN